MSLGYAQKYASLSPCLKRQVGCVVTQNGQVISYGFNHGYEEDCSCNHHTQNPHVLHAEAMALSGDSEDYRGATLWVTYQPCMPCAALILSKRIAKVIYSQTSKTPESIHFLDFHGIPCELRNEE